MKKFVAIILLTIVINLAIILALGDFLYFSYFFYRTAFWLAVSYSLAKLVLQRFFWKKKPEVKAEDAKTDDIAPVAA